MLLNILCEMTAELTFENYSYQINSAAAAAATESSASVADSVLGETDGGGGGGGGKEKGPREWTVGRPREV